MLLIGMMHGLYKLVVTQFKLHNLYSTCNFVLRRLYMMRTELVTVQCSIYYPVRARTCNYSILIVVPS